MGTEAGSMDQSPETIRERILGCWLGQIDDQGLLHTPQRKMYFSGERVTGEVFAPDGSGLGKKAFVIREYAGSGFAGQVYRARLEGEITGRMHSEKDQFVALKVLKPRNRWKRVFRDALFGVCFQTSYAARLREPAVRVGLLWQSLLYHGANLTYRAGEALIQPLGYFWDSGLASFVEVHPWITGRQARYAPDESLAGVQGSTTEMTRQKLFMDFLVRLCAEAGAIGLGRQYAWDTMVSQANVLVRAAPRPAESEFVGVDWRQGLAVPFFMPLSPGHLKIILRGLRRGEWVYFDAVDLPRLEAFSRRLRAGCSVCEDLSAHILKQDEKYRSGLADLWRRGPAFFGDRTVRRAVELAAVEDWRRLGRVSPGMCERLMGNDRLRRWFWYLGFLPVLGAGLQHWLGNENYRRHVGQYLFDGGYRRAVWKRQKVLNLVGWFEDGRMSETRLGKLAISNWRYTLEWLFLSWLPARVHILMTDREAQRVLLFSLMVHPVLLMFDQTYRQTWLVQTVQKQAEDGRVGESERMQALEQVSQVQVTGFGRDAGFTVALEILAKPFYALLIAYGLTSGNFWPFALAAFGPVPPSGLARFLYASIKLLWNLPGILRARDWKFFWALGLGLVVAPWRFLGNLFAPLELFSYAPQLSQILADSFVARLVHLVPVYGGRGLLLEYWAFRIVYSLPLALHHRIQAKFTKKRGKNS